MILKVVWIDRVKKIKKLKSKLNNCLVQIVIVMIKNSFKLIINLKI